MQQFCDKFGTPDDGDPLSDQFAHQFGARLIQEGDRIKIEMYVLRPTGRFGAETPQLIHPWSENLSFEFKRYRGIALKHFANLEHVAILLGRSPPKRLACLSGPGDRNNGRNRLSVHDLRFERINDVSARRLMSNQ
jgi:hypothetical protein